MEDRLGIEPDLELVEILDSAEFELGTAHRKAVAAWVQRGGFQPVFQVGDVVKCRHGTGPVHKIDQEQAQYIVATTDRDWGQGGGYIINAEDVTAAEVVA